MKILITLLSLFVVLYCFGQSSKFDSLWNDPLVQNQITDNIEKYRKGDAVILVVNKNGNPLENVKLYVKQETHAFLFGCNLFVLGQLKSPDLNRKYETAFSSLFNFATIPFYWRDIEPSPDKLRFKEGSPYIFRRPPPDELVKWCKANDITPKGHALLYLKNAFMPDWVVDNDSSAIKITARKHLVDIAQRYSEDIPIWDAVNEEMSRVVRPYEWRRLPDNYLSWAFKTADQIFPAKSKLLINEGNHQALISTDVYMREIGGLLQKGIRLDGIGIQFHVSHQSLGDYPPDQQMSAFRKLGRFNLPLWISEITIPGTGENGSEMQAIIVTNLYKLWFSTPSMAGITWWNLADGTAYKDENKALGGLLDKDMNPKPAYKALDSLINHKWKTSLTLTTDTNGKSAFRGFHGKYSISVVVDGREREFPMEIKNSDKLSKVVLVL